MTDPRRSVEKVTVKFVIIEHWCKTVVSPVRRVSALNGRLL